MKRNAEARMRPSFVKVLSDYTTRLRLPPDFVQKHGESLPEAAKLRTTSGETWQVKLKEEINSDDEDEIVSYMCFLGGGWKKFVTDLELKLDEILVFCFNGKNIFDVRVYGSNCCERYISAKAAYADPDLSAKRKREKSAGSSTVSPRREDEHEDEEHSGLLELDWEHNAEGSKDAANPSKGPLYFEVNLKAHQRYRVCLRNKFVSAAGFKEKEGVDVQYSGTRHGDHDKFWVGIDHSLGTRLTTGWFKFVKSSGLAVGKTYSFEFKPEENVIHVKEV